MDAIATILQTIATAVLRGPNDETFLLVSLNNREAEYLLTLDAASHVALELLTAIERAEKGESDGRLTTPVLPVVPAGSLPN